MPTPDAEAWAERYRQLRPALKQGTRTVHAHLRNLLAVQRIKVLNTTGRTKSVRSFYRKISRRDKNYTDPLLQVTDLCGLRVVTYHVEETEAVAALVREHFDIDLKNSVDKSKPVDPDRFGYKSIHYVVRIDPSRPEFRDSPPMSAEIQIRTILQHAWAEIDHPIRYKSHRAVSEPLQRDLFRLSALLELGDLEFSRIREAFLARMQAHREHVRKGALDIVLDIESLRAYLQETGIHRAIAEEARSAGFRPYVSEVGFGGDDDAASALLLLAKELGLTTVRALDSELQAARPSARRVLEYVENASEDVGFIPVANPYEVLMILLLYQRRQGITPSLIHGLGFPNELGDAIVLATTRI